MNLVIKQFMSKKDNFNVRDTCIFVGNMLYCKVDRCLYFYRKNRRVMYKNPELDKILIDLGLIEWRVL